MAIADEDDGGTDAGDTVMDRLAWSPSPPPREEEDEENEDEEATSAAAMAAASTAAAAAADVLSGSCPPPEVKAATAAAAAVRFASDGRRAFELSESEERRLRACGGSGGMAEDGDAS
jgi:hypothetical protein